MDYDRMEHIRMDYHRMRMRVRAAVRLGMGANGKWDRLLGCWVGTSWVANKEGARCR